MTLPSIPAFAWFLGTPEERNLGGRVMLMWADSVLPYSVDPPTVPTGDWWN